jgi:hypothetical protein
MFGVTAEMSNPCVQLTFAKLGTDVSGDQTFMDKQFSMRLYREDAAMPALISACLHQIPKCSLDAGQDLGARLRLSWIPNCCPQSLCGPYRREP